MEYELTETGYEVMQIRFWQRRGKIAEINFVRTIYNRCYGKVTRMDSVKFRRRFRVILMQDRMYSGIDTTQGDLVRDH